MTAPTPAPAASVLIVSGLRREAAMLAGPDRITVFGDGPTLRGRLSELARLRPSMVISWGVCGGLDPRLRPGDLILGAEVVSAERRVATDKAVTSSLARRLIDAGARVTLERVAGVGAPVSAASAKAELRRATGAAVVDMESVTAAGFALERQSPFVILRAVADPAERDLPPLVLGAVDSDGQIKAAAVFGRLARSPCQLPGLLAAARDSQAAFGALGRCRGFLSGLFLGLGPANL
jgi:hopanoid-associated phosphorylase